VRNVCAARAAALWRDRPGGDIDARQDRPRDGGLGGVHRPAEHRL